MKKFLALFITLSCIVLSSCDNSDDSSNSKDEVAEKDITTMLIYNTSSNSDNEEDTLNKLQNFVKEYSHVYDIDDIATINETLEMTDDNTGVRMISIIELNNKDDYYNNIMTLFTHLDYIRETYITDEDMQFIKEFSVTLKIGTEDIYNMVFDRDSNEMSENVYDKSYMSDLYGIYSYHPDDYSVTVDVDDEDLKNYEVLKENDIYMFKIGGTIKRTDGVPIEKAIVYINVIGENDKNYTLKALCTNDSYLVIVDEELLKEYGYKSCEIVGVLEG